MDAMNDLVYKDDGQVSKFLETEKVYVDVGQPGAEEGVFLLIKELDACGGGWWSCAATVRASQVTLAGSQESLSPLQTLSDQA